MLVTAALWLAASGTAAGPVDPAVAAAIIGRPADDLVAAYQQWDLATNQGLGRSTATTSGDLAWGEASFLRNYMLCYEAVGDPYWLDKMVDHVDRILSHWSDQDGDGFLEWRSIRFSVGLVEVVEAAEQRGVTISPTTVRENVTRQGEQVTGHTYRIALPTADRVVVTDLDRGETILDEPYADGLSLDLFAPAAYPTLAAARAAQACAPLTLQGPGAAGAAWTVRTTAPGWIAFVVHDGMVWYPITLFIEAVTGNPALPAEYHQAAQRYLELFWQHVHQRWQSCWQQLDESTGAYAFSLDPTERFPGVLLPHNQYLALARAYLVMQAVPAVPAEQRAAYRTKAEQMARLFQRHLRPTLDGRAYDWNYWDPPEETGIRRNSEDYSHATIDVGFVHEAARRQTVFTPADLARLGVTYTEVMGNGDLVDPRLSFRVDGSGARDKRVWFDWALAGTVHEPALRFAWAMSGGSDTAGAKFAAILAELGAVDEATRARAAANSAALRHQAGEVAAGNWSFEVGVADQIAGWRFAQWSAEVGAGRLEWSAEAKDGQRSAALVATAGTPNLVLQLPDHEVTGPTRVTVRYWYRTSGSVRGPSVSLIADRPGAERQYDTSPAEPVSETWREAVWSCVTAPGVRFPAIYLRSNSGGTIWFDAVELSLEPLPEGDANG